MESYCFHCGRFRWLRPGYICTDCLEGWYQRHIHRALP